MPDTPARLAALGLSDPPEALVAYVAALEGHAEAMCEMIADCHAPMPDCPCCLFTKWQAEQARAANKEDS